MSRPIKVASYAWPYNAPFQQSFDPWSLFFENKRIINRISNFNLLRCKLNVKVMVNGNGFHYGRCIMSYLPLHLQDTNTMERGFFSQDLIAASQRPHVYIDPTESMGGQLKLPFFFYKDALSIPQQEWQQMGQCTIHAMNNLKHANGGSDAVTISVFVWAEEVELAVPTSSNPTAMTPQMGEEKKEESLESNRWKLKPPRLYDTLIENGKYRRPGRTEIYSIREDVVCTDKCAQTLCNSWDPKAVHEKFYSQMGDEYGMGAVSQPASTVAAWAGALTSVPIIGPYARATSMIAGSLGSVAKLFGYSKPAVIDYVRPFRSLPAGNMANTNVDDGIEKLSLDVKQELCIDPRTVGLGSADEMSMQSVLTRESYLTTFGWSNSDDAEHLLFTVKVMPNLYDILTGATSNTELHCTPMSYLTTLFQYWRGTIMYRFQIVGSTFHKGRIRVVYEPYIQQSVGEYNVNYSTVVDIAEAKDFTIECGWGSQYGWLMNAPISENYINFGNVPISGGDQSHANGIISVYVVNELTSPSGDNPIDINVFVKGSDTLEMAGPRSVMNDFSFFPQSGEGADAENTIDASIPIQDTVIASMANTNLPINNSVYMGEQVLSLRSLIKRYDGLLTYNPSYWNDGTQTRITTITLPSLVPYAGRAPGAISTNAAGNAVNNVRMNYLSYITPLYAGVRGSMRYKVLNLSSSTSSVLIKRLSSSGQAKYNYDESGVTAHGDGITHVLDNLSSGASYNNTSDNPVSAAEVPYYSNYRFIPAKRMDVNSASNPFTYPCEISTITDATNISHMQAVLVAAGEDFSCFFFMGCPVLYVAA